ncbi:MAG TPA: L-lactate permease [Gemmataceae bacterium]|jgi:lactate permease|nr:L-lactate permease [Gemmataceae bacterium]
MLLLAEYHQELNPLNNRLLSTAFAALPVLTLFWLLVPRRWLAPKAAVGGAIVAVLVAWLVYRMPLSMAAMAFVHGAGFGLLPVGWTIFNAMLLYNVTVETGHFTIVRRSVAGLSGDARIQAILIGFAFGAFIEGAAGGGTPVAICGAIMVGLGFDPFLAAVLCLIANTSPVAYGGLGTPLITLNGVTDLPTETLSIMAGHQLPLLSFVIPLYMIKCMCTWKQTWEVWPALLVSGGSFAIFQFTFATLHNYVPNLVLYPMTDIGGGIFSLVLTAIFLKFWKPRREWHFDKADKTLRENDSKGPAQEHSPHTVEATAIRTQSQNDVKAEQAKLGLGNVSLAWAPYAIMSLLLLLTGLVRQEEQRRQRVKEGPIRLGSIQTRYAVPIPLLHKESLRAARLQEPGKELQAESAEFDFAWLTAPGSAVFGAAILSMLMLRMNGAQVVRVFRRTFFQMKIPIPTIACMLGLSYVTRYAGMDATLGIAFAETGLLYPFFAAILGWLGVFLTGTDAGSNALFGSLQKITASEIFAHHTSVFQGVLEKAQLQVLICTANSTGGVMGKMIDAQSICVATAATNQLGKEANIFKAVIWHSIILAAVIGVLTMLQAYVSPFTHMVPLVKPPGP